MTENDQNGTGTGSQKSGRKQEAGQDGQGSSPEAGFLGQQMGTPIARRQLLGLLGGAALGVGALSAGGLLLPSDNKAFALPTGTIGLTFDSVTEILAGESAVGRIYTYDLGGADTLHVSIDYESSVFDGLALTASAGVTILAENDEGDRISAVLMIDPAAADYSNLLTVTARAGSEGGSGRITLSYAKAAIQGTAYEQMSINADDNTITVTESTLDLDDVTLATLSKAMTFYQVTEGSAQWASAAKYDLVDDGVIDIQDFVRIANILLDLQNNIKLKFHEDGSFKILSISDYHDYVTADHPTHDPRTTRLINKILDEEQPDLVIINGDLSTGHQNPGVMSIESLKDHYGQMAAPLEEHGVPWFVTFGNHDEDNWAAARDGFGKEGQLSYVRSTFPHNINRATMSGPVEYVVAPHELIDGEHFNRSCGVGDMYTFIYDNEGVTPLYNIWALDSNAYSYTGITRPKPYEPWLANGTWDWIYPKQIDWYYHSSLQIEEKYGKLNSLMFFHIPLHEWGNMYAEADKFGVTGERGERECPGNINTGLYAQAFKRGDVKGMICGHDHDNWYRGNYYGIMLAYDGSVGYDAYGAPEKKGGLIIELNTNDLTVFKSRMVHAEDYGLPV